MRSWCCNNWKSIRRTKLVSPGSIHSFYCLGFNICVILWQILVRQRVRKKSTDVTNNINDGPVQVRQWASVNNTRTLKLTQLHGIQPSLVLLFTPVFFLHVKALWRKVAKPLLPLNADTFNFCTFLCFCKILEHFHVIYVSLWILIWKFISTQTFMHLFCLNFAHETITYYSTLSFLICCLLYCWLTQRWMCEVLSCWHPVWFYHMCLGWNVWFSLALYMYAYKSHHCFCFHMFTPLSEKRLCETNDASNDVTGSSWYPMVIELVALVYDHLITS